MANQNALQGVDRKLKNIITAVEEGAPYGAFKGRIEEQKIRGRVVITKEQVVKYLKSLPVESSREKMVNAFIENIIVYADRYETMLFCGVCLNSLRRPENSKRGNLRRLST